MIVGIVTPAREAIVQIGVYDPDGKELLQNAVLDTGYNGWLTLPPSLITALNLKWDRFGRAVLADGGEIIFNIYEADIHLDGQRRTITVDEMDAEPLIGMSLLYGVGTRPIHEKLRTRCCVASGRRAFGARRKTAGRNRR